MTRHYYAEYCPWGTDTISDGDYCAVFDSRADRDKWVDTCNRDSDGVDVRFYAQSITAKRARAVYDLRHAGDLVDWDDLAGDYAVVTACGRKDWSRL